VLGRRDVAVVLSPDDRRTVGQISNLPLRGLEGNYVPLTQLADIYETSGRYIVLHQGARRVQTITCNVAGRDVPSFVAEAKQRLASIPLPPGGYLELAGTAAARAKSAAFCRHGQLSQPAARSSELALRPWWEASYRHLQRRFAFHWLARGFCDPVRDHAA
jgi:hypothetical protein